jgi:Co/Zn/Cd efflux system component
MGARGLYRTCGEWHFVRGSMERDANMRSAWICTRNDVLGNLAVLIAAFGVFGTGTGWPDILVAGIMASSACGAFLAANVIQEVGL